ncbi:SubName: Full=Uncharacterized protein {ECO:0000313/EMBL:CCA73740.1} [Serendipita indica DSM 11827]|uniref:Uncharacterized protein n=1 Tax=Serendipita indica (strain DSM 11827) TaxID=1109443 RepID=G4TQZ7_SERID|nr:SubName: Full=Uncharacterized protein {ECO:0000313/EMBL:CCA73740.1} [Serendipita indica DSM 11827]CCA73740.1 hypothetical protein PIIN_07695 [Serendipita indica DSM 11827]
MLQSLLFSPLVYADQVHVVNKPRVRVTTALVNFHARIIDQWGDGSGKLWTIANDSYHPFAHRQFGGGTRREIRGTNMFGSGYPYGAWNTTSIACRLFPFGVWPLHWGDFMDSDEVGARLDAIRPGGHLSVVPLRATKDNLTVSPDEVYYAVGDSQSLLSILISYVTWCHASLAWPTRFDPMSPNTKVKLDNVLMYYRASSFALASPTYNNTNSRNASYQPITEWIPKAAKNSPFWHCLDSTTANALPIMNPPPRPPGYKSIPKLFAALWWILVPGAWVILVIIGSAVLDNPGLGMEL